MNKFILNTIKDIDKAVEIFKKHKTNFELMHCVSTYPMNIKDANLITIKALREKYKCKVGYSGHESGLAVSYAASALNITSLEKHITLDRSMYGSDQSASIEPAGLKQLVGGIRKIEKAMGDGKKIIINDIHSYIINYYKVITNFLKSFDDLLSVSLSI